MGKIHLLSLTDEELKNLVLAQGEPAFRARQIADWLYGRLETTPSGMSNLSKGLRGHLEESCTIATLEVAEEQRSVDGTTKWAFRTPDGHLFETVLIPTEDRRSLCISSQVGCAMGCTFCRTASMGFIRNLTLGEIVEQVHFVARYLRNLDASAPTNVIFMGMGEPLHNLETVARACERLSGTPGFGISKRKLTVSTSGIVPKILEWAERAPDYKLAISLNGSNDAVRSSLMPVNRRYPIEKLMEAADRYIQITGQRLTFEYILIKGLTSHVEAARELKRIAAHRNCKLNLIPLNPGDDPALKPPDEKEIEEFEKVLAKGDFQVLRRKPRGRDIFAACGQLAINQKKVA